MTTEEKAKAYDNVAKMLKTHFEDCTICTIGRDKIMGFFPQLAESEDERTRKWLIRYIKDDIDDNEFTAEGAKNANKAIAWLEKQKEQQPADWSEEDELMRKRCIADLGCLTECEPEYKERYGAQIKWLKSLSERFNLQPKQEWGEEDMLNLDNIIWLCENCEKGIETIWIPSQAAKIKHLMKSIKEGFAQKPAEWSEEDEKIRKSLVEFFGKFKPQDMWNETISLGDVLSYLEEQKPVEWSEDDYKMIRALNNCIDELEEKHNWNYVYSETDNIPIGKVRHWLKSLPNRLTLQPKQEWSEEDEWIKNSLIHYCEDEIDTLNNDKYGHEEIVSDLKDDFWEKINWLKAMKERFGY